MAVTDPIEFNPVARVNHLGERAIRACMMAAAGRKWTPAILYDAAHGLTEGLSTVGCRRPWPSLGKRVKNIAAQWAVLHKEVKL